MSQESDITARGSFGEPPDLPVLTASSFHEFVLYADDILNFTVKRYYEVFLAFYYYGCVVKVLWPRFYLRCISIEVIHVF